MIGGFSVLQSAKFVVQLPQMWQLAENTVGMVILLGITSSRTRNPQEEWEITSS
jgi:hypothetical protein